MKKLLKIIPVFAFIACNEKSDNNSSAVSEPPQEIRQELKHRSAYEINPDHTYVELNSGKRIQLAYDSLSKRVIEESTNREISFFVDETTRDTMDAEGNIVNGRVRRNSSGSYELLPVPR